MPSNDRSDESAINNLAQRREFCESAIVSREILFIVLFFFEKERYSFVSCHIFMMEFVRIFVEYVLYTLFREIEK